MDAAAADQQHTLDLREFEAWKATQNFCDQSPAEIVVAWHAGMRYGRRTPYGTLNPTRREQTFVLLDDVDHELQALHLILAIVEHWLPVKKLDGELPEVGAANSVARARVARYLLERFQEHPF